MTTNLSSVLIRPHVTEKSTVSSEKSVYVFVVDPKATKALISKAIKDLYNVTPVKIATVTIPAKNVIVRGKRGKQSGYKKAYVYVKKGDKIEIV